MQYSIDRRTKNGKKKFLCKRWYFCTKDNCWYSYRNNQQDETVWYNLLFQCFLIAQHVSSDTPLIIRSSKTLTAASGFTYVCGCRQLSWLSHDSCRQPQTYVKPEFPSTVFELLMMSGTSLKTCWAIKKHWNNKLYYTVASCWLFLYELYYDAWIHEHQVCWYSFSIEMYGKINMETETFE